MCTDCQYYKDQSIQLAAAVEGYIVAGADFKASRFKSETAKRKMNHYKELMKQLAIKIKKEAKQQTIF